MINKQKTIDSMAIRDTSIHNGDIVFNGEFAVKTIVIENGLNQLVTLQCQASINPDFSNSFNVGSSWDVAASTNSYQSSSTYFPYMRITAICSTAPASGALTVTLFGVQ